MERISAKRLPPVFKMSVLCIILPYYGNLHRWKRLLEKINTKTKDIWDQNREQLMYIGRDFKRDIELDNLKEKARHSILSRSWIDLFSLSLSSYFYFFKFNFTTLIDNLTEDEVLIVDSHDDIFKAYQIYFWRKDRISDILPAIKCPSFKSETKIFKTYEKNKIKKFIYDQNYTKSVMIENADDKISINLVYGNTVKITSRTFNEDLQTKFSDKLKERYELWKIDDCACKPKKIRAWANDFEKLQYLISWLKSISNINDFEFLTHADSESNCIPFPNCDTMFFNNSARLISYKDTNFIFAWDTNFIFTGDTLAVVYDGHYYNFRLGQRTKKSEDSYIKGKI